MRSVKLFAASIALAAALYPATGCANDAVSSVSAGGIVFRKTDAIAMKKEVLNVSYSLISVDYEFVNESARDVEETIVFPLPAYPVSSQTYDTYYGQPNGFSIRVDGKPVNFTTRLVALIGDKDVTARLKKIGLSEAQIAYNPDFAHSGNGVQAPAVAPITPAQHQQLVKAGMIGKLEGGERGALWRVQVNYIWQQAFPVNRVVRVHHEYRPFTEKGPGAAYMSETFAKDYCADKEFFAAHAKIARRKGTRELNVEKVAYILKSGNTWKRGIEDFTLNVIKGAPDELISLCFPGTFKKIDATTYQVRLQRFHPAIDLDIYFGNVESGSSDNDGVMPTLTK